MRQQVLLIILLISFQWTFGQKKQDIFDELQENVWYLPTTDGNANLYITNIGIGDTIVTLHGGPGNNFNYLVDGVRGNSGENTFIFFDQRGSLLSPVKENMISGLTIDVLVEDLELIRKNLKQEKMILFGHSFGSLLAIFYYIKYPEHVKGIILSATMPPYIIPEIPFKQTLKEIHSRINDLRDRPEVETAMKKAGLMNDSFLSHKEKSDRFKITGLAAFNMVDIENWKMFKGGGVYYNSAVDSAIGSSIPETYDIRPTLDLYPVPITIIQGEQDYIDPSAKNWTLISSDHDFVKLNVVKNASHNIWLDNKERFNHYVRIAIDNICRER